MKDMSDAYGLWRKEIGDGGYGTPYTRDKSAEVTGTYSVRIVDVYSASFLTAVTLLV